MPSNVKTFNQNVLRFAKALEPELFVTFQKKVALEVFTRTVKRTPVKTGRARGNWQIGIEEIPTGELGSVDKEGGGTIASGLNELSRLGVRQTVYIVNNLEYISFLEDGTSSQAPRGMLALSLQEVNLSLNE